MRTAHPETRSAALALLLAGCGVAPPSDSPAGVAQTADAMETSIHELSLLMSVARAADAARPADVLDRAAAQLGDFFTPSCATALRVGSGALRVTLRNCAGRFGLRNVTGELLYTFELADGGLRVSMRAAGLLALLVGASRITELDSTALFRVAGGQYTATLERSTYTAFGARGQYVRRDASLPADPSPAQAAWQFTSGCLSVNGAWRVRVGPSALRTRTVHVAINNYRRCLARCPDPADDAVVVTDEPPGDGGARSVTLSFDGGSAARWTSTEPPASGVVALACMN